MKDEFAAIQVILACESILVYVSGSYFTDEERVVSRWYLFVECTLYMSYALFDNGWFDCLSDEGVNFVTLNLSKSRPLLLPQKSVSSASSTVGMLIANSFVSSIN